MYEEDGKGERTERKKILVKKDVFIYICDEGDDESDDGDDDVTEMH